MVNREECLRKLKIPDQVITYHAEIYRKLDEQRIKSGILGALKRLENLENCLSPEARKNMREKLNEELKTTRDIEYYKLEIEEKIKKAICDFIETLMHEDLKDRYIEVANTIQKPKKYNRFLASAIIYTRLHNNLQDVADKFIYLVIAVEAAKRYGESRHSGNTEDFVGFFINNLSDESIKKTAECFQVDPRTYEKEYKHKSEKCINRERAENLFRYLYKKRSSFVHEGRLFELPAGENIYVKDVFTYKVTDDCCKPPKNKENTPVLLTLTIDTLCDLYEEALLKEFKSDEGGEQNGS